MLDTRQITQHVLDQTMEILSRFKRGQLEGFYSPTTGRSHIWIAAEFTPARQLKISVCEFEDGPEQDAAILTNTSDQAVITAGRLLFKLGQKYPRAF